MKLNVIFQLISEIKLYFNILDSYILFYLFTELDIFHIGKRIGAFIHWEPIFIGTNFEPMYDERLSWEGKSDKMTQVNKITKTNLIYYLIFF